MKGLALVGALFLGMIVALILEYLYLQLGIQDSAILRTTIRETKVIETINTLEFMKRSQKPSLEFSFYKTYDFLGNRGGFSDLTALSSYDCIPYWQIYDTKTLPDIKQNIETKATPVFNEYMNVFQSKGVSIPNYQITIENIQPPYPSILNVQVNSNDNLELTFEKVMVSDKSSFTHKVPIGLFQEYALAKENLIDTSIVKKTVEDGINSVGLSSTGSKTNCGSCPSDEDVFKEVNGGKSFSDANDDIKNKINGKLQEKINNMALSNFQITYITNVNSDIKPSGCFDTPGGSCNNNQTFCTRTCNFDFTGALDVLFTVENKNVKYLIENEFKIIPLKFRIIDGSMLVTPITNDCID